MRSCSSRVLQHMTGTYTKFIAITRINLRGKKLSKSCNIKASETKNYKGYTDYF